MNYALVENDVVVNIIWLNPMNLSDFPNAVLFDNIPVIIGDVYKDGKFYRDMCEVKTMHEALLDEITESYNDGYDDAVLDLIEQGVL